MVPSLVAAEVMLLWTYSSQDNWELQKEGLVRTASSSWLNLSVWSLDYEWKPESRFTSAPKAEQSASEKEFFVRDYFILKTTETKHLYYCCFFYCFRGRGKSFPWLIIWPDLQNPFMMAWTTLYFGIDSNKSYMWEEFIRNQQWLEEFWWGVGAAVASGTE